MHLMPCHAMPYGIWRQIYHETEMNHLIDTLTNADVTDISCYLGGTACGG